MWLAFSQFRISCTQVFDKLICETVLRWCSQRHYREEPSVGARSHIEGDSGLTDHRACLGSKSEIIGSCTDDYFLHRLLVNEIILASSARFPCPNIQSRDRSPPRVENFDICRKLNLRIKSVFSRGYIRNLIRKYSLDISTM